MWDKLVVVFGVGGCRGVCLASGKVEGQTPVGALLPPGDSEDTSQYDRHLPSSSNSFQDVGR